MLGCSLKVDNDGRKQADELRSRDVIRVLIMKLKVACFWRAAKI